MANSNKDREALVVEAAVEMHRKWMVMVNFRHPHSFSSRWKEAHEAIQAERKVRDEYDAAFAHLTAECELLRQERMK